MGALPFLPPLLYSPFSLSPKLQKFFLGLKNNLPPLTVSDRSWPPAPYRFLANANEELKTIFYHWKVARGAMLLPRVAPP